MAADEPSDSPGQEHRRNTGLANLRPPWQPGESGNPGGRPRGRSLTSLIREVLDSDELDGIRITDNKTVADLLAAAFVRHAISGNATYAKEVIDRIDGKVPPPVRDAPPETDFAVDLAPPAPPVPDHDDPAHDGDPPPA